MPTIPSACWVDETIGTLGYYQGARLDCVRPLLSMALFTSGVSIWGEAHPPQFAAYRCALQSCNRPLTLDYSPPKQHIPKLDHLDIPLPTAWNK
jgi:hypothetical protein